MGVSPNDEEEAGTWKEGLEIGYAGKGKGKGKAGKGGLKGGRTLVCYRCGGTGHPQAICTSKESKGGVTCKGCGGRGHYRAECPTVNSPQPNAKGEGNGKSEYFFGKGSKGKGVSIVGMKEDDYGQEEEEIDPCPTLVQHPSSWQIAPQHV